MDSITTLIVEDEPMLAEILVDTIKQFPQFEVIGIADKLESAKKMLRPDESPNDFGKNH